MSSFRLGAFSASPQPFDKDSDLWIRISRAVWALMVIEDGWNISGYGTWMDMKIGTLNMETGKLSGL